MSLAGLIKEEVVVSDEALVADVRRGDDRAFEELYGRYQRRIWAYVLGMVQDHGRAEDVTQEVFMAALRRMRATERPIAFKPWIYEIAKNACIDQFRRARRTEEVSLDGQEAGALDSARLTASTTPDAAVDAKQQLDDLCGAFGGLSEAHHQILVLRELEGLSYQEIGERLNLSRPSVESTLFRARRRLTEEYEELVSGERCRAVQALAADGANDLGARDRRRLARHVAHCQPCRRHAALAGVDTVSLTRSLRTTAARRVAALVPLPLPGLWRLRRDVEGPLASWAAPVSSVAEPAVGWTKAAIVAATVLVAGGAGVAGHAPAEVPPRAVPAAQAPPAAGAGPAAASSARTAPPADAPPRTAPGARVKPSAPAAPRAQVRPQRRAGRRRAGLPGPTPSGSAPAETPAGAPSAPAAPSAGRPMDDAPATVMARPPAAPAPTVTAPTVKAPGRDRSAAVDEATQGLSAGVEHLVAGASAVVAGATAASAQE